MWAGYGLHFLNAQLDGLVMRPDELDPNKLQFGSRISPNYTEWVGSVSEHEAQQNDVSGHFWDTDP